eukprot:5547001-Heterocapsa_arctica.AAC.1
MEEDWLAAARRECYPPVLFSDLFSDRAAASASEPTYWRRQRAEDNFILPNQDVIPTTSMETKIK